MGAPELRALPMLRPITANPKTRIPNEPSFADPRLSWRRPQAPGAHVETEEFPLPPVEGSASFNYINSEGFVYEIEEVRAGREPP